MTYRLPTTADLRAMPEGTFAMVLSDDGSTWLPLTGIEGPVQKTVMLDEDEVRQRDAVTRVRAGAVALWNGLQR